MQRLNGTVIKGAPLARGAPRCRWRRPMEGEVWHPTEAHQGMRCKKTHPMESRCREKKGAGLSIQGCTKFGDASVGNVKAKGPTYGMYQEELNLRNLTRMAFA